MPKKLTFDDVQQFIKENDVNNECTLLSTEYINSSTPLKFRCNLCGQEFERDFSHIKRKRFRCPTCGRSAGGGNNKLSIENVKAFLKENDVNNECTLLSTEYINNSVPLKFRCNLCGQEFERDFDHVQRKRFRCPTCGIISGAQKLKYTKEDVEKILQTERNYTMIGNYVNANTEVLCKCSHGHEFNLIFSYFLVGHSGCKKCANEQLKSKIWTNSNISLNDLSDYLRHRMRPWRAECLKAANFTCDITGSKVNLIVHHLSNFSTLRNKAIVESKIDINNFTNEDIERLVSILLGYHKIEDGVVLTADEHKKFHQKYGYYNNTKQQYQEFKKEEQEILK